MLVKHGETLGIFWYLPRQTHVVRPSFLAEKMLRKAPFSARRSRTNLAMFGKTRRVSRSENRQWLDFPHLFQFTIAQMLHVEYIYLHLGHLLGKCR